ncbi:MAG: hypothetical protein H3C26_16785 [Rhodocyclaceae bacterium]|nr:hypothetical protein [Rhodocyclaceae bacterium]
MAKALFECADCGNSVVVVGRNRSEADRRAAWHQAQRHICADCEAKNRATQSSAAAAINTEAGLPALTGSERQVAWAETIRLGKMARVRMFGKLIDMMQSLEHVESLNAEQCEALRADIKREIDNIDSGDDRELVRRQCHCLMRAVGSARRYASLVEIMNRQTRASWWIDHRDTPIDAIALNLADDIDAAIEAARPQPTGEVEAMHAAQEEALLKPAEAPKSPQVAEIRFSGKELHVTFAEKREDFRLLMRGMGFHWAERYWVRTLGLTTGEPIDRMAETAHRIIGAGFMARLHDDEAHAKAISGDFAPEQTRWVTKTVGGAYDGWCRIQWSKTDDLYAPAKCLLGARYKDGYVYVPPGSILEVMDFADRYGFAASIGIREMLAAHQAALAAGAVIADPKAGPTPLRVEASAVPARLDATTGDIDPELREED